MLRDASQRSPIHHTPSVVHDRQVAEARLQELGPGFSNEGAKRPQSDNTTHVSNLPVSIPVVAIAPKTGLLKRFVLLFKGK
jgi:hypothetical protein